MKGLSNRLKNLERERVRQLWSNLDNAIPGRFKKKHVRSSAGSRSLGAQGRTSVDIASDAIAFFKQIHEEQPAGAARSTPIPCPMGTSVKVEPSEELLAWSHHREGMLSARGLLNIEVEMREPLHPLVHREWIICRVGRGAEHFWVRHDAHSPPVTRPSCVRTSP
jgi:hypothetical protein